MTICDRCKSLDNRQIEFYFFGTSHPSKEPDQSLTLCNECHDTLVRMLKIFLEHKD